MFVACYSYTTGAISGARTANPSGKIWVHPVFSESHVALSFVFCVVLCRSLFFLFSCFFWPLCSQSFGHCVLSLLAIVFSVIWSLCSQSFGHCLLSLLAIVFSVFWPLCSQSFGHCVLSLLVIVFSVFWSLCSQSFGHCVLSLLAIVFSVFWPLCSQSLHLRLLINPISSSHFLQVVAQWLNALQLQMLKW
jgi:hypothetical protein